MNATPTESRRYLRYVLFLLFSVQALNIIDRHLFGLLIEPIKAELGVSDSVMGFMTGLAFAIFYSLVGIPVARWADRGTRRDVISISLFLWSLMTAACGLAQTVLQMVTARIAVGIGEAGGSPPSHALIADYFPLEQRGRAMGLASMGGAVGITISLLAGGLIAETWGWRAAFIAMGLPGVLLAIVIRLTLREPERGRYDPPQPKTPALSTAQAVRRLLAIPALVHISLAGSLHSFAGYGGATWNAVFLMRVHDFSIGEAGVRLALYGSLAAAVSVFAGGRLADAFGRRDVRWYQWLPALGALAHLPFAFAFLLWPDGGTAVWFLIPSALLGGLWAAPGHAMVQSLAPPQMRATASALMLLMFNLIGFGLGPWAVGILNDTLEPQFGAEAVRYSLLLIGLTSLWGTAHNVVAARTLARDLARESATE